MERKTATITGSAPQAKNDFYNETSGFLVTTEKLPDYKISISSLLSNDLGGNAKKFLGLGAGSATSTFSEKEASVNVIGDNIVYNPSSRFDSLPQGGKAEDTFTYTIQMGNGATSTATVRVLVKGVNDAPVGNQDSYEFTKSQILQGSSVLENDKDLDMGDSLTASLVSSTQKGNLNFNNNGTFTYTPNTNYVGPDSFTYKAFDGKAYSDEVTVNLSSTSVHVPQLSFGASVMGISYKINYDDGDYFHQRLTYEDSQYSSNNYDYRYDYKDESGSFQTQYIYVQNNYYVNNYDYGPFTNSYSSFNSSTGSYDTVRYEHESHYHVDASNQYQGIMEFDVSEGSGLVSGATLRFDTYQTQGYNNLTGSVPPGKYDIYVHAGDGMISTSDFDAGTLAGSFTVEQNGNWWDVSDMPTEEVSLDASVINPLLSTGETDIAISIRSALQDPNYTDETQPKQEYSFVGIKGDTVSLDPFYV